jgi:hypothetical protein
MSYLNALRLHFAGQFQANISTINNDPAHFYNEKFIPDYQKPQDASGMNGWFNPQGDATWRLLGCNITSAWTPSGQATADDSVLGCVVADSDERAPAKLVDLDSEQQLVSEIWGMQVRIVDGQGNTLLRSDFKAAPFTDIWDRATGSGSSGGDVTAGAMYQSVLTNVEWYDVSASPFLTALRQAAGDGTLSIKFNVDGINFDNTSPYFMCGRIVGTIGPHTADEPEQMILGRHFVAEGTQNPPPQAPVSFFRPVGQINHCVARLDAETSSVFLDLGNALPTATPGGPLDDLGTLLLSAVDVNGRPVLLGAIMSQEPGGYVLNPGWYARTAGVVVLKLDQQTFASAANSQLVITGDTPQSRFVCEWNTGAYVRADHFVYRLTPGDTVEMPVYAMQWGQPLANTVISFTADPSQLQPGSFLQGIDAPPVAWPSEALGLAAGATATTDANGCAVLSLTPGDPHTPRFFNDTHYGIDGQVYGIRPAFVDQSLIGAPPPPVNQWDFISVLLWSGFTPSSPVNWEDVQPIFQQYANLYPVMGRFLDLGNYDDVVRHARLLKLTFGLDPGNPNSMPVTRDLSPAKRSAILAFLENPVRTEQARPEAPAHRAEAPAPTAEAAAFERRAAALASKGGKAAAAARRLFLQKR